MTNLLRSGWAKRVMHQAGRLGALFGDVGVGLRGG